MQFTVNTRATDGGATKIDVGSGPVTIQVVGTETISISRSKDSEPGVEGIELTENDEDFRARGVNAPLYLASDVDGADVRVELL